MTERRSIIHPLLIAATFTAMASLTDTARADIVVGGDLDYAFPIDSAADSGPGFGLRLGNRTRLPALVLAPELAFTYHSLSGDFGPNVYRGVGGLRLAIGEILRPGIFGHLGVGHLSADFAGRDVSHTAFTYDAGAFLELTLLPLLNLGIHGAYNSLTGDADLQWITAGLHVDLVF